MDRYRVIITPRASSDIESIHRFIEQDSPQNAAGMIQKLIDAIDSLQILPHRYSIYSGARRPSTAVRKMVVYPYLLYYRVDDGRRQVDVVTIRHGKRRQPRSFK
jgi:plasmid stabilization system protein ParE